MRIRLKERSVLPGFAPTLGLTLFSLSLLVLIPLSVLGVKTASLTWGEFWETVASERAVASYRLSLGAAAAAGAVNTLLGSLVAWVLVRYEFPGRRIIDGVVDLPFALPTAVAGIALTTAYADTGWIGRQLASLGIHVAFTPVGVILAMTFVGFPLAVRTIQPVLQDLDAEVEEAAASLGASRWATLITVIFPELLPAMLTGFALAFARGLGEYGSVVFISGNMPMRTEVTPLLIMTKLEQYDYAGATALAMVMLVTSFLVLLIVNRLERWAARRHGG